MKISLYSIAIGKPVKNSPRRVISRFDIARMSEWKDTEDFSEFAIYLPEPGRHDAYRV
jgi:hypothetical protein